MAQPPEVPQSGVEGEDFYPADDEEAQKKIVAWVNRAFISSRDAKQGHQDRWEKYYKMYRSYVKKRPAGDWKSRVWMPFAFYIIETITPRLVAQLPSPVVKPVGPEDAMSIIDPMTGQPGESPAKYMEELLLWAADQSEMYLELVKALKSALLYGTGILKTSYEVQTAFEIVEEPMMEEQFGEAPTGEYDNDGNAITTQVSMGAMPMMDEMGQPMTQRLRKPYDHYAGPVAEAVDITNFFIDPAADDIASARYVIHRVYRDKSHLEDFFERGIYKRPPEEVWRNFLSEHASISRQALIGLGPGNITTDEEQGLIPVLEMWTDNVIVAVAGDETTGGILLRAEVNPYMHGEKPFVRIVDHLVPHEFWGIGELEPLEGLQDAINSLWNSRLDNVKLNLNSMFMAVMDYMVDPSDLQIGPSKVIRVRDGVPLDHAVKRLELGDVTQSSYVESQELERMIQMESGVNPYTTGSEGTESYNRTATGVALISEQGNTRFSHKVKIAELTGFKHLFRQFGMLLQQFAPPQIVLRLQGPLGAYTFANLPYDAISGRFDFDIEAESSTQTESVRREQTLSLFQLLAADPYMRPLKLREDVLKEFGRKNVNEYLYTEQELQMMMQQQAAQEQEQAMAEEAPPEGV